MEYKITANSGIHISCKYIVTYLSPGFSCGVKRKWNETFEMVQTHVNEAAPALPAKKIFRSKFGLPKLKSYRDSVEDPSFWSKWPKQTWEEAKGKNGDIKADILKQLALETKYPYPEILEKILGDLTHGSDLGFIQGLDVPSDSTNAPTAFECGAQISDAICKMIDEKFVMGPFKEDELPFEENRFSGIMAKMKPNNTARMILNLSKGFPQSVNSGIDKSDFPTMMGSTEEFLRVLHRCGRGAEMTKNDWAAVSMG